MLVFFQLARIQTDSVVEKLKELHPDVNFEIGKTLLSNMQNSSCLFVIEFTKYDVKLIFTLLKQISNSYNILFCFSGYVNNGR